MLRSYEDVFPGCAERIVAMAERQSSHRQAIERDRIKATNKTEHWGQVFAFILAMSTILGGVYLISIGKDGTGLAAILTALGSLVGVFLYGKYTQTRELKQKRRPLEEKEQAQDRQLDLFDRNEGASS